MAAGVHTAGEGRLGATQRRDAWWLGPLATAAGLGLFAVYATFRALARLGLHPLAVLLATDRAPLAAGLDLPGDAHPVGAGRVSPHVLLLPQGVLPRFLPRSAGLRRR